MSITDNVACPSPEAQLGLREPHELVCVQVELPQVDLVREGTVLYFLDLWLQGNVSLKTF